MALITIFGGQFKDAGGNIQAGATLSLQLTSDGQDPAGDFQIVGGPFINCTLDANGNVPNLNIESNATISPTGTGYIAKLYNTSGLPVWLRPQIWVLPNVSTDLGTLIPASSGAALYFQSVVTNPSADQTIASFNLLPSANNLTQSLGNTVAPWNGSFNNVNISNVANFTGFTTVANLNVANVNQTGLTLVYNGIAAVNGGLSAIRGGYHNLNVSANVPSTQLYRTVAAGAHRLSWYAKVTTPATTNSVLGPLYLIYTDPDGVSMNVNCAASLSGTIATNANGNLNTTVMFGVPAYFSVAPASNINVAMSYASNGATAMLYTLHTAIESLG